MSYLDSARIGGIDYEFRGTGNSVSSVEDYRWQHVAGEITPNSLYNWKTASVEGAGNQYTTLRYLLDGEKKVRISGASSGSSAKLGYVFLDSLGAVLSTPSFVSGELFENAVIDVPEKASEIYINGNNYESPHLEVAVADNMSDSATLPYLLKTFGRKTQYRNDFAWKPMDKAHIAFTFDDSLDDVPTIVDLFISKGVPCCFGAIPDKLNMSTSSGETITQAMQRGIDAVGCEVLAHGNNDEMVTADNIDDMNFLYNKFVVNNQKFADCGFNVRGVVRVGGNGNICNDPRTDEWVRMVYDYGDLYGISEPYNHPRISVSTLDAYKKAVDTAIENKTFEPLLFHAMPDYLEELIDYVISQGAVICNYAYVYDTYGSTKDIVSIENRLQSLGSVDDGNEVEY